MKGLGHAILTGEPLIGDQAFGVLLADDLCINQEGVGVLQQMSELYNQFRCSIVAVMEVPEDQISAYVVIAGRLWETVCTESIKWSKNRLQRTRPLI